MNNTQQHYLVTGGAGFIGSHLVEALLAAGHHVTVLDDLSTGHRRNLVAEATFHEGCITRAADVTAAIEGCSGVFHLAAIASVTRSMEAWAQTHRINQGGAVEIFDAAAKRGIPVVYASSAAVYGDNTALPLAETATTQPLSPYGLDKLGCEWQAAMGHRTQQLASAGMRFFNIYGPRQDPYSPYSGVISVFAEKLRKGEPIGIFGDGQQTRDFVYVQDVVNALRAAMALLHSKPETCLISNVCRGKSVTIRDLAHTLNILSGKQVEILHLPPREGDIMHSCGDPHLLEQQLHAKATTTLKTGLTHLWNALS